jgi:hypothetical protein
MRAISIIAVVTVLLVGASAAPAFAHGDDEGVDVTELPVGSAGDAAGVGELWTCQTSYSGGGAETEGPWFNGDGTFNLDEKVSVEGSVEWPDAEMTVQREGDSRVITTKDLPTDDPTGEFPIASDTEAYQYDRNPNSIAAQDFRLELPYEPGLADEPSCVGGEVGILKSGVVLFNAVDAGGRDAVAYEIQDSCDGHPQVSSAYHYHSASSCVLESLDPGTGQSKLIGWAFDGFGIYGPRDADGNELTSADLDECHGTTSKVKFNGKKQNIYHYVATVDFPYTVGCFRGTNAISGGGLTDAEQGPPR